MRKRNIRFELCLNEEENICLNELCHKTRLNKSTLIRYLILGYKPAEADRYSKKQRDFECFGAQKAFR